MTEAVAAEHSWQGVRVLVTGARGFIGRHLVASLQAVGAEVVAADHRGDGDLKVDLRDGPGIREAFRSARPAVVINLAAVADPRQAEQDPIGTYEVNVLGQLRVILALRAMVPQARLVVVGSALQYGRDDRRRPIREDDPQRPDGVYAVTKAAADLQASQHHRSEGLDIVRLRLFNVIGPGRPEEYFPAPQIRQAAEILDHGAPPVINTLSLRDALDFVDVRDTAKAIQAVAARGRAGGRLQRRDRAGHAPALGGRPDCRDRRHSSRGEGALGCGWSEGPCRRWRPVPDRPRHRLARHSVPG